MRLLFKILIIIAIVLVSLFFFGLFIIGSLLDLHSGEPTYEFDETQKDILPILPTTKAGIPQFVKLLREAKETKDVSICNSLPESQKWYAISDYMILAPTQEQWSKYCEVLVNDDPLLCEKIPALTLQNNMGNYVERGTEPHLYSECKKVFGSLSIDELVN